MLMLQCLPDLLAFLKPKEILVVQICAKIFYLPSEIMKRNQEENTLCLFWHKKTLQQWLSSYKYLLYYQKKIQFSICVPTFLMSILLFSKWVTKVLSQTFNNVVQKCNKLRNSASSDSKDKSLAQLENKYLN